ncbi:glycoside hydrolase family 95 protein [Actinoplanes sp. CA-054009]
MSENTIEPERLLWSDRPAAEWLEAFPLGNGRLGAMVHGTPGREHLQINDGTAWSGSPANEPANSRIDPAVAASALESARAALDGNDPGDAERHLKKLQGGWSQAYLPFADLRVSVSTKGETEAYHRELDLLTAMHQVSYRLDGVELVWGSFVSQADGVLVLTLDAGEEVDVAWELGSPLRVLGRDSDEHGAWLTMRLPSDMPPPHEPDLGPVWDDEALRGAVVLRATHDGRPKSGGAERIRRLELVLATETTFAGIGRKPKEEEEEVRLRAAARTSAAAERGASALAGRHVEAYRNRFGRTTLALETARQKTPTAERRDDAAALLFQYGRYLAISSSAPGGLPSTLQGLWNNEMRPPWSSNYTINVNTQMNYWATETADLGDCLDPVLDLLEALADKGRATASRLYGARGWVAHHNTDAWAFTSPVGRGQADPSWSFWPMGGVWLCWLLRGRLREDAARCWPVLRGAAEFCLDWLRFAPDGTAGTSPSTSPENHYLSADGRPVAVGVSSTMDLALIAGLFDMFVELAGRLDQTTDPVVAEVLAARSRIPAPEVAASGLIPEWLGDPPPAEPHHRHVSHLVFAYPGDTPADPAIRAAVSRSLDARGDESTGWSLAWKLALRARLRQPENVSRLLDLVLRPAPVERAGERGGLYPNLFAAHPPFQIDGNLGYVAAVAEMLVQSHAGVIEVLPAVPAQWPRGRVTGLVARPGVAVDVAWETVAGRVRATEIVLHGRGPAGRTRVTVAVDGVQKMVDLSPGGRVKLL